MSNRLDQERQARLEPSRLKSCKEKLESLGFVVTKIGPRLDFEYRGSTVRLFPYSGWHTGKTIDDGRGFEKLLEQLK